MLLSLARLFLWVELIGFDCASPDFGVGAFLHKIYLRV